MSYKSLLEEVFGPPQQCHRWFTVNYPAPFKPALSTVASWYTRNSIPSNWLVFILLNNTDNPGALLARHLAEENRHGTA